MERRRGGYRSIRRQKVSREGMVKFFQAASRKERLALADRRAEKLAKWLLRATWAAAIGAVVALAWVRFG